MTDDNAEDSEQASPVIEKLTRQHDLSSFHCGKLALDDWLKRFALVNQQNDSARTYVLNSQGRIHGYYSLAAGSVRREEPPERIAKGLANQPIGVILLARLAVDRSEQGRGIGKMILADALSRAVDAADIIAARAILVHALDEEAAAFYAKFDFGSSPFNTKLLMLLLQDLRATLRSLPRMK